MARSYRDNQKMTARPASHGETDIHYGKRFAETEAILKARAEERAAAEEMEKEAVEAPDRHLGSTEEQVTVSPGPPSSGAVASEVGIPAMARERLGAMPAEELPPAAEQVLAETPAELLGAFRDQVTRSLRGVGDAARQLRSASGEVAGLPLEGLRVVVRVGRSWLGRSPRRA